MQIGKKEILFLAIFMAVASIIALNFSINSIQPEHISLFLSQDIPKNTLVEFTGEIESIKYNEKSVTLKVCDSNCLTTIVDKDASALSILSEGDWINVVGTTKSYYKGIVVYAQEINYVG